MANQIDQLKVWAESNYSKGYGYQVLVECWDNAEWQEALNDCGGDTKETKALAVELAEIWNEQYAGANHD